MQVRDGQLERMGEEYAENGNRKKQKGQEMQIQITTSEVEVLTNQPAASATEQANHRKRRYATLYKASLSTQKRLQEEWAITKDRAEQSKAAEKLHAENVSRLGEMEREM